MDYLTANIAINLKRIRKSKKMSLDTVAEQTGVSKSLLAQIERAEANPTIGILGKIVSGLRVEFDDLIQGPKLDHYRYPLSEMVPTKEVAGQYKVYTCIPISENKVFELYHITIEPHGKYTSGAHGEGTYEYITIVSGELDLQVDKKTHHLTQNDIFKFDTDKKHIYSNELEEKVVFYSFFLVR